jgi:hypothetical protein
MICHNATFPSACGLDNAAMSPGDKAVSSGNHKLKGGFRAQEETRKERNRGSSQNFNTRVKNHRIPRER